MLKINKMSLDKGGSRADKTCSWPRCRGEGKIRVKNGAWDSGGSGAEVKWESEEERVWRGIRGSSL